jgi:hypothetical protein
MDLCFYLHYDCMNILSNVILDSRNFSKRIALSRELSEVRISLFQAKCIYNYSIQDGLNRLIYRVKDSGEE